MPRQLPWKRNGGGGSRTQTVKPPSRLQKPTRIVDDIDDDFFAGTVLANDSDGKGKARAVSDSGNSLLDLPTSPSTPRTKRTNTSKLERRAPLSSSPPLADYALPHSEPMRKGVSKFDLRDDEWMMVEDEFLETAKLFTRHLHIAEYDKLKESIEAKKKEAEAARPVVAGAKRSVEGMMKERAKVQENKQKKAIRDVFASQGDLSEDERASYRSRSSKHPAAGAKSQSTVNKPGDTDSDDLDAPRPPKPKASAPVFEPAPRSQPAARQISKPAPSSFAKPALPSTTAARPRARASRMKPFDMLDEYAPPKLDEKPAQFTTSLRETLRSSASKPRSQSTSFNHFSPQASQATETRSIRPRRSVDLLDDWGSSNHGGGAGAGGVSKEVADRIAKRKADRGKESDGTVKRRATKLDDIPTFLF